MMQAIIGNYAVPVLEEKQVWGTSDDTRTAYLDSQVVYPFKPDPLKPWVCYWKYFHLRSLLEYGTARRLP